MTTKSHVCLCVCVCERERGGGVGQDQGNILNLVTVGSLHAAGVFFASTCDLTCGLARQPCN